MNNIYAELFCTATFFILDILYISNIESCAI